MYKKKEVCNEVKIAIVGLDNFPLGKKNFLDDRLKHLESMFHPPKTTCVWLEFIAGDDLKEADLILCKDIEKLELIFNDLEFIDTKLLNADLSQEDKNIFLEAKGLLEKEDFLSSLDNFEKKTFLSNFPLITLKPIHLVSEAISFDITAIIKKCLEILEVIFFFTVNDKELKSWPIKRNTTAYQAAGLIHSDIQRGFIKAEVISYSDLIEMGGINQAKSAGRMHLEDKDYIIKDGDLIKFRFSV